MSKPTILPTNTRLEIGVGKPGQREYYFTRVLSSNENELRVAAPLARGQVAQLPISIPIVLKYQISPNLYNAQSMIVDRFQTPVPGLILKAPKNVKRVERRNFFRLPRKDKVFFRPAGAEAYLEASYLDISGGGLKLYAMFPLKAGDLIELILEDVDGLDAQPIYGKVVRSRGYEHGISFQSIPTTLQDHIVRWIFDKQREAKRNARKTI